MPCVGSCCFKGCSRFSNLFSKSLTLRKLGEYLPSPFVEVIGMLWVNFLFDSIMVLTFL